MLTKPDAEAASGPTLKNIDESVLDALMVAPSGRDEPEVARLRLKVLELTARNERLRETVAFQLGSAIISGLRSPRELIALPGAVYRLFRLSRERRGRSPEERAVGLDGESARRLLRLTALAPELSPEDIITLASRECRDAKLLVQLLAELARSMRPVAYDKSVVLARRAFELDPTPLRSAWLAEFLFEAGMIEEPNALYSRAEKGRYVLTGGGRNRREQVRGLARIHVEGVPIPERGEPRSAEDASVLYVAATSYPHHVNGYSARTHSLLRSIQGAGWRVEAVTRPGYPLDRTDARRNTGKLEDHTIDGVTYQRLAGPPQGGTPLPEFINRSAEAIGHRIARVKPALVHAASNHVNALPALIAARKAGLPFIYEVRGLWELTSTAKAAHWEGSERFALDRQLEILTAREADAVVTISRALRDELIMRGIDGDKITLAPNSVDIERFTPQPRDVALAERLDIGDRKVLGYIGTMTVYEGLTDLVAAVARLREKGLNVCAVIVGDGPVYTEVREAARRLDVLEHVILPGRVSPDEVNAWYSIMDVAVYPRRPLKVTEVVPPLKPLEAMAMELPVVASDVAAICETVMPQRNGLLFSKGDIDSLVEVLAGVLADPDGSKALGRRARLDVEKRFAWTEVAKRLNTLYRSHARISA